jgi:streptomycin 6-kinase
VSYHIASIAWVSRTGVIVPQGLTDAHAKFCGETCRAWIAALPELAARYLDEWALRRDGPAMHGMVALVLPVLRADGTPAVLKLQHFDPDHPGEASALRAWDGDGAVRLLSSDTESGAMLLERLTAGRDLRSVPDVMEAVEVIAGLLRRLHAHPPPPDLRRLADVVAGMLEYAPAAVRELPDAAERRLVTGWAHAVREVAGTPGGALLHWDLHYENVLAGGREAWLAIDPKPLAGDPGFDLCPALWNRWDEAVATGDVERAVRRRFDAMVDALGLERERAAVWTVARVLQNTLWDIEDGRGVDPVQVRIAAAVTSRPGGNHAR